MGGPAEPGSPADLEALSAAPDTMLDRPDYVYTPKDTQKPPLFSNVDELIDTYDRMSVQATGRDVPEPLTSFNQLVRQCSKRMLRNMVQLKFQKPTPVQKHAIPVLMSGRDLMACSATGSGKTAAFLVPVLARITQAGPRLVAMPGCMLAAACLMHASCCRCC
jgi:ATP-dependent helicase YprA (DUF1998 family)